MASDGIQAHLRPAGPTWSALTLSPACGTALLLCNHQGRNRRCRAGCRSLTRYASRQFRPGSPPGKFFGTLASAGSLQGNSYLKKGDASATIAGFAESFAFERELQTHRAGTPIITLKKNEFTPRLVISSSEHSISTIIHGNHAQFLFFTSAIMNNGVGADNTLHLTLVTPTC